MSNSLQDDRRHSFYITDNEFIDRFGAVIGPYGIAIYAVLARLAGQKETAYPSYQTMAEKTGMSRIKAVRTVEQLVEIGLIKKTLRSDENGHTSNLYTLVDLRDIADRGLPDQPNNDDASISQTPPLVSEGYHPSISQTPPLVSEGYPKNTQLKNTQLKKIVGGVGRARAAQSPETQSPPPPAATHPVDLALPNPPTEADMAQQVEPSVSVRAVKYKHTAYAKGPYLKGVKLVEGYVAPGEGINAVQVYHERNCADDLKLQLTDPQQDDLIAAIEDLDRWRRAVVAWSQAGYNPRNLGGQLDWYGNGIPERGPNRMNGQSISKVAHNMNAVDEAFRLLEKQGVTFEDDAGEAPHV